MLVKDRMTLDLHTISPDTPVAEALNLMRQHNVRRLPILDKKGHLVGIVTEKDLLYASPSPATSLSVYEVGYLLSKLKVEKVMTSNPISVSAQVPLEEAAKIMIDNLVSGLPVMEGDKLVGIITETDIFKVLMEMLGARDSGIRMTLKVHDEPGMLSLITGAIAKMGGDIITLGTFYGEESSSKSGKLVLRVCGITKEELSQAMQDINIEIQDIREV